MMFKTHLAFGFLVGLLLMPFLHPANQIAYIILVMLGAALSDIDHPESKIGRHFKILGFLFEHRGFFHSIFALPLVALIVYLITHNYLYALPILIGYLSHLLIDALTLEGVMLFHPFSNFRIRGFFRTGSFSEYIILLLLILFDALKLFKI